MIQPSEETLRKHAIWMQGHNVAMSKNIWNWLHEQQSHIRQLREALEIALGEFEIPTFHNTREKMQKRMALIAKMKAALRDTQPKTDAEV